MQAGYPPRQISPRTPVTGCAFYNILKNMGLFQRFPIQIVGFPAVFHRKSRELQSLTGHGVRCTEVPNNYNAITN